MAILVRGLRLRFCESSLFYIPFDESTVGGSNGYRGAGIAGIMIAVS